MLTNERILHYYIGISIFFSIFAIALYIIDKIRAVNGKERIPEKVLLFLGVFFGSVGSIIGRIIAHHKTNKIYFSVIIYSSFIIQVGTLITLILLK